MIYPKGKIMTASDFSAFLNKDEIEHLHQNNKVYLSFDKFIDII